MIAFVTVWLGLTGSALSARCVTACNGPRKPLAMIAWLLTSHCWICCIVPTVATRWELPAQEFVLSITSIPRLPNLGSYCFNICLRCEAVLSLRLCWARASAFTAHYATISPTTPFNKTPDAIRLTSQFAGVQCLITASAFLQTFCTAAVTDVLCYNQSVTGAPLCQRMRPSVVLTGFGVSTLT